MPSRLTADLTRAVNGTEVTRPGDVRRNRVRAGVALTFN
jgi:hypothetical protein